MKTKHKKNKQNKFSFPKEDKKTLYDGGYNMIKHINELRRFDFTGNCKQCQFVKKYNELEYCCSFVLNYFKGRSLQNVKEDVQAYVDGEDFDLSIINPDNICFTNDDEFGVRLLFQTNLNIEKWVILRELRKAILKSPYFANVNFIYGSLYHKKFNEEQVTLEDSRLRKKATVLNET